MFLRFALGTASALVLAGCQTPPPAPVPDPSIGVGNPYPVSNYRCGETRLAVRLMGERASVSIDGAPVIDLPVSGSSGTTFSNGRQTLIVDQGRVSWGLGRAVPVACTGG